MKPSMFHGFLLATLLAIPAVEAWTVLWLRTANHCSEWTTPSRLNCRCGCIYHGHLVQHPHYWARLVKKDRKPSLLTLQQGDNNNLTNVYDTSIDSLLTASEVETEIVLSPTAPPPFIQVSTERWGFSILIKFLRNVYWVVEFTRELMEMHSHYDPALKIFKLRPSPLVQPEKYQSAYGNKLALLECLNHFTGRAHRQAGASQHEMCVVRPTTAYNRFQETGIRGIELEGSKSAKTTGLCALRFTHKILITALVWSYESPSPHLVLENPRHPRRDTTPASSEDEDMSSGEAGAVENVLDFDILDERQFTMLEDCEWILTANTKEAYTAVFHRERELSVDR
ncbi:hypothetical protein B0H14DRAFT_2573902 [Mycena olivaceomarginata]|nr:hypothetical protein B0H14DRAFT_2573902 [Mycena olivaceomarginata]